MAPTLTTIHVLHPETSGVFGKVLDDYAFAGSGSAGVDPRNYPGYDQEFMRRIGNYFRALGVGAQKGLVSYIKSDAVPGSASVNFVSAVNGTKFAIGTVTFTGQTGSASATGSTQFLVIPGNDAQTARHAANAVNDYGAKDAVGNGVIALYSGTLVSLYSTRASPLDVAIAISGSTTAVATGSGQTGFVGTFSSGSYGTEVSFRALGYNAP